MLIDGESLIARQLAATERTEVVFPDGRKTTLTPARGLVPMLDDYTETGADLPLDDIWTVYCWPFAEPEVKYTMPRRRERDPDWVVQPGKVFYADPEAEREPLPNWNRVTLSHLDEQDGAIIRQEAKLPKKWAGRRILLRFDGIYPAGRVYLNGELLGEHLSGLTPVEFDVTDQVKLGKPNYVAVRLLRKHRFVQMDMVRHSCEFAGLSQPAYFHAVQPCHIRDYWLPATLSADLAMGTVEGTVTVVNAGVKEVEFWLEAEVRSAARSFAWDDPGLEGIDEDDLLDDGEELPEPQRQCLAPGATLELPVKLTVVQPDLWNDEFPNLYRVELRLCRETGPEQSHSFHVGFRRFELTPEGPRLNGHPVKFRGVNHLTFHPDYGMYTPKEWLRQNLLLMKKANVNAVRTHYLGPRALAEVCDEVGIYLLQELPIDWGTHYIHDPEWVGPALQRLEGGIRRDRHHPSVMVWSIGNENMPESTAVAADGWNHLRLYERFAKTLDPTRPTMFPPPGPANKITGIFEVRVGDIADTHYSFNLAKEFRRTGKVKNPYSWQADMVETTREEALARGWSGVWFSSEYGIANLMPDLLHDPSGSIIDDVPEDPFSHRSSLDVFEDRLRREWGLMREDPTCLGGAYFPWMCAGSGQGLDGNPWGWVRWAEDADWGVVCADLTVKPAFWAMRGLFSPVWFPAQVTWRPGQQEIRFPIWNQYNAIDLKDCILRTQQSGGGRYMTMLRRFRDVPVACPPGEQCEIAIPLWDEGACASLAKGTPALCRCTLLNPRGMRTIMAQMLIVPEQAGGGLKTAMTIGPDAVQA